MLDATLAPRILDFGLSAGDPSSGHFVGTLPYVAPEQLDRSRPIDARTDVYALGVILYELLCGATPYRGNERTTIEGIRAGTPRLPGRDRTVGAGAAAGHRADGDGARRRAALPVGARHGGRPATVPVRARPCWHGRRCTRRPSRCACGLTSRRSREWLRLRLIYPHEAERLQVGLLGARRARGRLDPRQPRALLPEDRALPRRFPPHLRQPVLFRRRTVVRAGRWRASAVCRPRASVRRPECRGALPLSEGSQSGRGRLLSRRHRAAAAVPAHLVPRNRTASSRHRAIPASSCWIRRSRTGSCRSRPSWRAPGAAWLGAADPHRGAEHRVHGRSRFCSTSPSFQISACAPRWTTLAGTASPPASSRW